MTAKQHLKALKGLSVENAYQYIIDNLQGFEFAVPEPEFEEQRTKTIDYTTLQSLQGELKDLKKHNIVKLVRSFLEKGFFAPLFVWQSKGVNYTFDGHQRHRVLGLINALPKQLPCSFIQASSEKDAKEKLLLLNGNYGETTKDGFDEFVASAGIEFDFLNETTTFERFFDTETSNINLDDFFEEDNSPKQDSKNKIVLKYTEEDYNQVIEALKKYTGTKEQIIFNLLVK